MCLFVLTNRENSNLKKRLDTKDKSAEILCVNNRDASPLAVGSAPEDKGDSKRDERRFSSSLLLPISPIKMKSFDEEELKEYALENEQGGNENNVPQDVVSSGKRDNLEDEHQGKVCRSPLVQIQNSVSPLGTTGSSSSKRRKCELLNEQQL